MLHCQPTELFYVINSFLPSYKDLNSIACASKFLQVSSKEHLRLTSKPYAIIPSGIQLSVMSFAKKADQDIQILIPRGLGKTITSLLIADQDHRIVFLIVNHSCHFKVLQLAHKIKLRKLVLSLKTFRDVEENAFELSTNYIYLVSDRLHNFWDQNYQTFLEKKDMKLFIFVILISS